MCNGVESQRLMCKSTGKGEFAVLTLGAFLGSVCYGEIDCLFYNKSLQGRDGLDAPL